MKDWFRWYWREFFGVILALIAGATFSIWFGKKWVGVNPEKTKVALEKCIEAGSVTGLNLKRDNAKVLTIGTTTIYVRKKGVMVSWKQDDFNAVCKVYRNEIDYFAVNGEDLTGKVKREERN